MLETVHSVFVHYLFWFHIIDVISVIIFTIEYLLRLWVCTLHPHFRDPVWGRVRYALTPLAIIDLLAILPFYLPLAIPFDLRELRVLRLFRIVRIMKLGRYSQSVRLFEEVVKRKKEDIIISICVLLMILVLASSAMYYAEHEAQPEKFASIPNSMWWGIVTLATVGYGDVYPVTPFGQFIGGIVVVIGIGVFALPTAILASGFIEVIDIRKSNKEHCVICPHCGMPLYGVESTALHDEAAEEEQGAGSGK
jgi:voltage-gated potassium channel